MIYKIITGAILASGWPIGALLYNRTKEELDQFAGKIKHKTKISILIAIFLGAVSGFFHKKSILILCLASLLVWSSFYSIKLKDLPKKVTILTALQYIIFLIVMFLNG